MSQEADSKRKGGWWSNLVGTSAALDAARSEAEAVFKGLQTEIARLEEELATANEQVSTRDERIESLDAELRHNKRNLSDAQQLAASVRKLLEASEAQARKQREEFDAQRKRFEDREAEATAAREALERELKSAKSKSEALGASLKESEAKVEKAVAELLEARRRAEADKSASAQREKQASERAAEASRAIATLKGELDTGAIELAKERDRSRSAQSELERARARMSELERAKDDIERANAVAAKTHGAMEEARRGMELANTAIEKQLVEERASAERAQSELATARAAILVHEKSLVSARDALSERTAERDNERRAVEAERRAQRSLAEVTVTALRGALGARAALALAWVPSQGEGVAEALATIERALKE